MAWHWKSLEPCDLDRMAADVNPQMKALEDYLGRVRSSDMDGKPSADGAIPSLATVSHTGNTTETELKSVLLGPGSVTTNGGIRVTASGTCSGAGAAKTIRLNWGGVEVASLTVSAGTTTWTIKALIFNNATNSVKWQAEGYNGTTLALMQTGSAATVSGDDDVAASLFGWAMYYSGDGPPYRVSWATLIAANGNYNLDSEVYITIGQEDQILYPGMWNTNSRTVLVFETSGFPAGAIVDSASITVTPNTTPPSDNYDARIVVTNSAPASVVTVAASDYQAFKVAAVEYGASRPLINSLSIDVPFTVSLNAAALVELQAMVTAGTEFKAGLMNHFDFDETSPPTDVAASSGLYSTATPSMNVVYHVAGGPTSAYVAPGPGNTGGLKWELEVTGQLGNAADSVTADFVTVEVFK